MLAVICPLCRERKARRACPALGQQICAICCGTKRLTEIRCPSDCVYLASAREHPPAAVVRQQQHDVSVLVHAVRDFNERQLQVFWLTSAFVAGYNGPELQPAIDEDASEAMTALAATYDTAARGVIYEHRPQSLPAQRLWTALKRVIDEAGKGGGSAFERDAAVVLRATVAAVGRLHDEPSAGRRAYLDLLGRVLRRPEGSSKAGETEGDEPSRLIVP
jgi:hypothetical protein